MARPVWRVLSLLLVAVTLAACPSLPQPYRGDAPDELTRPLLDRIILIRPANDSAAAVVLAKAMEVALAEMDVPALVRLAEEDPAPPLGEVVLCDVMEMPAGGLQLSWTLLGPHGDVISEQDQLLPRLPPQASPKTLRPWMQSAARELIKPLMKDQRAVPPPREKDDIAPPAVYVVPLAGVPGDGNRQLFDALRAGLSQTGLKVQDTADQALYKIAGRVTIASGPKGQDAVTVIWRLTREPDGVELATITQNGMVPQGQVQKSWAGIAPAIAEAGVGGLLQVMRADQGL